jgi:NDP-sugar pyrophosphorylase family protein
MINVLIPMAGLGQRFIDHGIKVPKPLIKVNNKTLIEHSIGSLSIKDANFIFITRPFFNYKDNEILTQTLNQSCKNFKEHLVPKSHFGAAHSSFYAKDIIKEMGDLDKPLIVTNCDQIMQWDSEKFLDFVNKHDPDGVVVLYKSNNPKNSFAQIIDGVVIEILEKQPISDDALVGIHYWKKASDFFDSAEKLIYFNNWSPNESYVSETYNFLISEGKTVLPYWLSNDEKFISLGTPEDLNSYYGNSDWKEEN